MNDIAENNLQDLGGSKLFGMFGFPPGELMICVQKLGLTSNGKGCISGFEDVLCEI